MPMIDVYAPTTLFPADADERLVDELTHAVLRAEGVAQPGAFHLDNTAAFIHRLPTTALGTAATPSAPIVRVQIVTPPGSLNREGQRTITREATDIVRAAAGSDVRTWVILTEAVEGGWGIQGTAFGVEEFTALAKAAAAAAAGS
ncbi:tautomerase family protein [Leifsonia aquatica]|nr:tautomerase family protein [Leifsonia aquatica]MBB2967696.1 phenylpyruvate tautomerase PptA (4-oxalocrotonate tautomerase family) [Leifsonia aquatica]